MKQELDLIGYIQFAQLRWSNELLFSQKEAELYQARLLELLEEFEEEDILEKLEKLYENFEKGKKQSLQLQTNIRKHVINNQRLVHSNGNLQTMVNSLYKSTRKEMEIFRKAFRQLKKRFHQFTIIHNGEIN